MIQYVRRCLACKRENGPYREMPSGESCYVCGGVVEITRRYVNVPMLGLLPEIPRHYNRSLGRIIESREHLRDTQRALGCEDASLKELKNKVPTDFK